MEVVDSVVEVVDSVVAVVVAVVAVAEAEALAGSELSVLQYLSALNGAGCGAGARDNPLARIAHLQRWLISKSLSVLVGQAGQL